MKHVYYCRHGLSVMNKQGLLAGSSDTPLAPEGELQAVKAGEQSKALGIDLIIASPMKRARKTAEIIADTMDYSHDDIIFDARTVERDFGDLEGTPWVLGMHYDDDPTVEPKATILARAQEVKDFIDARPEHNILVVSHGSFIRALRSLYTPDMVYENATASMPNAEIVQII